MQRGNETLSKHEATLRVGFQSPGAVKVLLGPRTWAESRLWGYEARQRVTIKYL